MKRLTTTRIAMLSIGAMVIAIGIYALTAYAQYNWAPPSSAFPNNVPAPPLDIGINTQRKQGDLKVGPSTDSFVGFSSTVRKIEFQDGASARGEIELRNSGSGGELFVKHGNDPAIKIGAGGGGGGAAGWGFNIDNPSSPLIYTEDIKTSVGIGTTDPIFALDVRGNVNIAPSLFNASYPTGWKYADKQHIDGTVPISCSVTPGFTSWANDPSLADVRTDCAAGFASCQITSARTAGGTRPCEDTDVTTAECLADEYDAASANDSIAPARVYDFYVDRRVSGQCLPAVVQYTKKPSAYPKGNLSVDGRISVNGGINNSVVLPLTRGWHALTWYGSERKVSDIKNLINVSLPGGGVAVTGFYTINYTTGGYVLLADTAYVQPGMMIVIRLTSTRYASLPASFAPGWILTTGSIQSSAITNTGKITTNELCLGVDCRISWPGGGGGGGTPAGWTESTTSSSVYLTNSAYMVGIGTSAPKEKVQIGDRITIHDGGLKIIGSNFYYGGSPATDRRILPNVGVSNIVFTQPDGGIIFRTAPASSTADSAIAGTEWKNVLAITNGGNVGVNITGPTEKLHVEKGNVRVTADLSSSGFLYEIYDSAVGHVTTELPDIVTSQQCTCDSNGDANGNGVDDIYEDSCPSASFLSTADLGNFCYDWTRTVGSSIPPPDVSKVTKFYKKDPSGIKLSGGSASFAGTVTVGDVANPVGFRPSLTLVPGGTDPVYRVRNGAGVLQLENSFGISQLTLSQEGGLKVKGDRLVLDGLTNNVGIGVAAPTSKLDVSGNVAIGGAYAGVIPAPANGLIVSGNVGIGTPSPTEKLHVAGNVLVAGDIRVTGGNNIEPSFPDGFAEGQKVLFPLQYWGSGSYTIPVTRTLYITFLSAFGGTNSLRYFDGSSWRDLASASGNLSLPTPIVLPGGTRIAKGNGVGELNVYGYEVTTRVATGQVFQLPYWGSGSYTVPSGKTFYVTFLSAPGGSNALRYFNGSWQDFVSVAGNHSLTTPIAFVSGTRISKSGGVNDLFVSGYLR